VKSLTLSERETLCTTNFITRYLNLAHKAYLCVPYGSHNKQRLFPYTALTDWALWWRRIVFPVRYELDSLYIICVPCGSHSKLKLFPYTA
jgi:hypothetical protein